MNAIKRSFKLLGSKSPFEKDIIKLLCTPDQSAPTEKMLEPILLTLKEVDSNPLAKPNLKLYFDNLKKAKRWEDAAKLLIIAHHLIYEESPSFIHEFATTTAQNIMDLPNNKEEFKQYVRCGLVKYYYRYLKKVAESYFSVRKCRRYSTADYSACLARNDTQIISQFSQLKEIVTFLTKVEDFYVSSTELQNISVMLMLGELMLRDCIEFYNLISSFVSTTIGTIFELPDDLVLLLDTLYSNLLRLHKPMVSFYDLRRSFPGKIAEKKPSYYIIDHEFNKKEELHVYAVKKRRKDLAKPAFQYSVTLPDRPGDHFEIDDIEPNDNQKDSERKEDDMAGGVKSCKATTDRKFNFEHQTLLTCEDKDYFDDETHQMGDKPRKGKYGGTNGLSPSDIGVGTKKKIQFSKIPRA